MAYIKGIVLSIVLLALLVIAYFTLDMWGAGLPFGRTTLYRIVITVGIVDCVVILLLIIFLPFLFKKEGAGYDKTSGGVAQRKNRKDRIATE
ncbi:MAG: hypothetical protein ACFNYD_08085 [Bacteroides sp.]